MQVPFCKNKVPLSDSNVPINSPTSATDYGVKAMPNTNDELSAYIKQHIREIVPFLKAKSEEKDFTNEELMRITEIPKSTFYRIWKIGSPSEEIDPTTKKSYMPDPDTICRLCLAIGVSLTEHDHPPTEDSRVNLNGLKEYSHEKIMGNMWAEISGLRNEVARLEKDRDLLLEENKKLMETVFAREADIRANIARNNKLTDALLERHDQMHELNRSHNERVDRMEAALRKRYDQLYELFCELRGGDPIKFIGSPTPPTDE